MENSITQNKEKQDNQVHEMQVQNPGYIRVLHAVPGAPAVDVYLNDKNVAKNLSYSQFTGYSPNSEGTYVISLFAAGTTDSPILSNTLVLKENMIITIAVIGTLSAMEFLAIPDYHENVPIAAGRAVLRFIHLSSDTPSLDVALPDGTTILQNVSFKEHSMYYAVAANNYTLLVKEAGTSRVILNIPNVNLESKTVHSIYAIGLMNGQPQLEAVILFDGFFI